MNRLKSCQRTRNHIIITIPLAYWHTFRWSSKEWSSHLDGVDLPIVTQISSAPAIKNVYIYIRRFFRLHSQAPSLYIFILKPENKRDETSIYSFICCNLICSFKLWKRDLFQKQFSSHRSCANFWHHWGGHGRVVPKAIVAWCWC